MGMAAVEPDFGAVGKLDIDVETRGAVRGVSGCGWHGMVFSAGFHSRHAEFISVSLSRKNALVRWRS